MSKYYKLYWSVVVLVISSLSVVEAAPNGIDNALYFHSQFKDGTSCSPEVVEGRVTFPFASNPAISCPDAFAWTKFLTAIKSEFWLNWANDSFSWPSEPYPLCESGKPSLNCCLPGSEDNPGYKNKANPGIHCPYFPADHAGDKVTLGKPAFKQHFNNFQTAHSTLVDRVDPGRVIRQEMAEVVYRNKPMWEYIFDNDLYNKQGLAKRFNQTAEAISSNAPYRPRGVRVEFPSDSVMFKVDWLHEDEANKLGLHQNKENPYITLDIQSSVGDNDSSRFKAGIHYLMAVTAASKDLPNWHWYAIEHVNNPGRCDYIGCNDAFGYASSDKVPSGFLVNYIKPKTRGDGLVSSSTIFNTGGTYPSGKITQKLQQLYKTLGIGQGNANVATPVAANKAWYSYRLKGTQTEFTTEHGVDTVMGNSVTEGGFVNTSSCMTCHSQATVDSAGNVAINSVGFSNKLNLIGYQQSANGPPNPAWFYGPGSGSNTPMAVKIDSVWGILFAKDLIDPKSQGKK